MHHYYWTKYNFYTRYTIPVELRSPVLSRVMIVIAWHDWFQDQGQHQMATSAPGPIGSPLSLSLSISLSPPPFSPVPPSWACVVVALVVLWVWLFRDGLLYHRRPSAWPLPSGRLRPLSGHSQSQRRHRGGSWQSGSSPCPQRRPIGSPGRSVGHGKLLQEEFSEKRLCS